MTPSPVATIVLAETTHVTSIDPALGPVARRAGELTAKMLVLVISASGKHEFRKLSAIRPAPPPPVVATLSAGCLAPNHPERLVHLVATQTIKLPFASNTPAPAGSRPDAAAEPVHVNWMAVTIPGARWIVAENLAIAVGQDQEIIAQPNPGPARKTPRPVRVPALRALTGASELSIDSAEDDGETTVLRFTLPPRTTTVRLSSRSARPEGDPRQLGVAIRHITLDETPIPLDSPALVRGFHRSESNDQMSWRWTDGDAL